MSKNFIFKIINDESSSSFSVQQAETPITYRILPLDPQKYVQNQSCFITEKILLW